MPELTYEEIYREFCEWSPEHAKMVKDYKPWGNNSILVFLNNSMAFKVKRFDSNHFIMQMVSKEDINRKYNNK